MIVVGSDLATMEALSSYDRPLSDRLSPGFAPDLGDLQLVGPADLVRAWT